MKKVLLILLIPFFGWSQFNEVSADSIISFAKQNQGIKYCYGNCTPKSGFDCSGFVYYVFGHFNIKVPRSSLDYETLKGVVKIESARKGDVIVFTGTDPKNKRAGHVGIVISDPGEDLRFIHASSGKKANGIVVTNYSSSPYYKSRFIRVVRIEGVK